jgi:hypothetical protein
MYTMIGTWNTIAMGTAWSSCHLAREGHNLVMVVKKNQKSFVQSPIPCLAILALTHLPFDLQSKTCYPFAFMSRKRVCAVVYNVPVKEL